MIRTTREDALKRKKAKRQTMIDEAQQNSLDRRGKRARQQEDGDDPSSHPDDQVSHNHMPNDEWETWWGYDDSTETPVDSRARPRAHAHT